MTTTATTRGKGLHITLWVLQVLLALFMGFAAALPKLFAELVGDGTAQRIFEGIGIGMWFMYVVGALELAGAIGLLIPRLAGLAAAGLAGVMVGATVTQLFILNDPAMAVTPVVLFALFCFVAWGRWPATAALLARFGLARPYDA